MQLLQPHGGQRGCPPAPLGVRARTGICEREQLVVSIPQIRSPSHHSHYEHGCGAPESTHNSSAQCSQPWWEVGRRVGSRDLPPKGELTHYINKHCVSMPCSRAPVKARVGAKQGGAFTIEGTHHHKWPTTSLPTHGSPTEGVQGKRSH